MIRSLKALGFALVAVFAMGAVAANGASAHEFTSSSATTFLTGTSESGTLDKFTVSAIFGTLTIECHGSFTGTQSGTVADEVTVTPAYSSCLFNGEAASVDVNGCDYKFDSDTDVNGHAVAKVACPGSGTTQTIAVTNNTCDMYFGTQTTTEGVTYTGLEHPAGSGKTAVTVKATVKATISEKKVTSTCFSTANTGTYESTAIVTGYSDAAHTNQVSISVS
jgi:hypothetical protein